MNKNKLNIVVMGAGGVGCYYGGMLARAGECVTLIARPSQVEALSRRGLRIQTSAFDEHVLLPTCSDPSVAADADVVLLCVKSPDTEQAASELRPHLRDGTTIFCLQNGVDNADRVKSAMPDMQVASTVVYVATQMVGAAHLLHNGGGRLIIEPSTHSDLLACALVAAGVPALVSHDVRRELWIKLTVNCVYNAISAISQSAYAAVLRSPGFRLVMRDIAAECIAVASSEGFDVADAVAVAVRSVEEQMPNQLSSMAQDLRRGKRSEIDYLNGLVTRRGDALGVPTPVNRTLWALVQLMESSRMGSDSAAHS
jgi:2-dehydropantoate 2-reductase